MKIELWQQWEYDSSFTNSKPVYTVTKINNNWIIMNDGTMYDKKAFDNSVHWKYKGMKMFSRFEWIIIKQ